MATPRTISPDERRARLVMRHRLLPECRTDDVVAITESLVALHSTDPVSVYLSAAARMATPALTPLEHALYEERTLLRIHAMRRTLWVMPRRTAALAHASCTLSLLGPEERLLVKMLEQNGIADGAAWLREARVEVLAALHGLGVATARQLGDTVPALRVPLQLAAGKKYATVQAAHTRVLLVLGFEGAIVRARPTGSWINGQYRWAAMDHWVPGGLERFDRPAASAELADLWLRAFGPATTDDLRWWMGWAVVKMKAALAASGAQEVDLDGTQGWVAAGDADPVEPPAPVESSVALLPALDPTTMGWRRRDWYLDPAHVPFVFDRNGNAGPTVWVGGRIVGGWVQRKDGTIAVRVLEDVGREATDAIDAAAHDLEALVGPTRFTVRFPAPLQTELLR